MKKFKTGLLALALVLGVSGAFVSKIHAAPKQMDDVFNWQQTDAAGNVLIGGQYDPGVDQAQAETDFSCSGSADPCAKTVDAQNGSPTGQGTILHN